MGRHPVFTRRQFLATGAAGAAALAAGSEALAQAPAPAQKFHVKPVPREIFIDHGINQETRLETLRGYLTPGSHFFVRQHATTPALDLGTWRLRIEGNGVERPVELSFDDLLRLPSRSVIAFVECAGNGRGFFKELMGKVASGTQWHFGGIGVAEWTGVPLGAVLELARVRRDTPRDILNVLVEGLDSVKVNRPMSLAKAFEDDTLLAYAFNGEPVPPDHGFPVRAIVPGWVGINNIKWVGRIEVRNSVIDVPTTTKTYVMEGPDYPSKPVLREQTIKSAVALPWGAMLPAGRQRVRGFAWSPVGRISRVDYSLDRGATWQPAALREPNIARAWARWDFEWDARPGDHVILTRAADDRGNTQPSSIFWNAQGYGYNVPVPHPVKVT
ncbi:MAG TPA: sulfite oxidase [Candidatus Acidoferrum sp.]|jgi:DMSO/TMAO reductase YedYZ molybdopterin-dependent catalytic subunit|nr:sulfite oxidase [Candidatus Acidoferrum sp.]